MQHFGRNLKINGQLLSGRFFETSEWVQPTRRGYDELLEPENAATLRKLAIQRNL
jgi:hypothetical protein